MFRFINSGLKQSVTTLPNSIYHTNIHKKHNDDETENKKLSIISSIKNDQTMCMYKGFLQNQNCFYLENCSSLLEKRNFIFEFAFDFRLKKSGRKIGINDIIFNLSTRFLDDLIGSFYYPKIPKIISESPIKTQCKSRSFSKKSRPKNKENNTKSIKINEESVEEPLLNLNELGHELNTKGCMAIERCDQDSAVKYWNCAVLINYPPAQFNLGLFYESEGDLVKAEKWYRSAVNSGDHPTAAYNLALLLNRKSDDIFRDEIKSLLNMSAYQGFEEASKCIQIIDSST